MAHFRAVAGSTAPNYSANVVDANGTAIDLTGATSVVLRMRHGATSEVVDHALTVGTPAEGAVSRDWEAGDLDVRPGVWWGQWRVTRSGGEVEIWPNGDPVSEFPHPFGWSGLRIEISAALPAPA